MKWPPRRGLPAPSLPQLTVTEAGEAAAFRAIVRGLSPRSDPLEYAFRCQQAADDAESAGRPDDAISLMLRAAQHLSRTRPRPEQPLALTEYTLSELYMRRPTGDQEANREAALHFLRRSTAHDIEIPDLYARAWGALGDRYARRSLGDPTDNRRAALEAYRTALLLAPPIGPRGDWALNMHHYGLTLLEGSDQPGDAAEALVSHLQAAAAAHDAGDLALAARAHAWCADALDAVVARTAEAGEPTPLEVANPPEGMTGSADEAALCRMRAVSGVVLSDLRQLVWDGQVIEAGQVWERVGSSARDTHQPSLQGVALFHLGRLLRQLTHPEPDDAETVCRHLSAAALVIDPKLHPWSWEQLDRELAVVFAPDASPGAGDGPAPAGPWSGSPLYMYATTAGLAMAERALEDVDTREPADRPADALTSAATRQLRRALALLPDDPAHAESRARVRHELARTLSVRPWRPDAVDHEEARTFMEAALADTDREAQPERWQALHHELGVNYQNRQTGSAADNREQAIHHLTAALSAMPEGAPQRAVTLSQLGNAHHIRLHGDPADNMDRALEFYSRALHLRDRASQPLRWAITLHNIAVLYRERAAFGNRQGNLLTAADCFREALEVRTRDALPEHWALTVRELGVTLLRLGDPASVREGEELLRDAQSVYTREDAPLDWAAIQWQRAETARAGGEHERAEALLRPVLGLSLERDRPDLWARVTRTYALACFDLGAERHDPEQVSLGVSLLNRSVERLRADGDWTVVARGAAELGDRCLVIDRPELAADAYLRALDADARRYTASLSLGSRESAVAGSWVIAPRAAYVLVNRGRFDQAVDALERGRSRMLGEVLARDRVDLRHLLDGNERERAAAERYLAAAAAVRALEAEERRLVGEAPEV